MPISLLIGLWYSMNGEVSSDNITRLLLIPRSQRSTTDVSQLMSLTKGLKFFHDLADHVHMACCGVMKVAFYSPSEVVFRFGDTGTSFCVVLKGTAEVLVPSVKEKEGAASHMVQAAMLGPGAAFGELALINNQPRAATIRANTALTLAVLQKDDYDRILKTTQDGQLREKVKFLRTFPLFCDWTQIALSKLTYFFLEITYKKGDIVYAEGSPVNDVFFLKSGEFQVIFTQLSKLMAVRDLPNERFPRVKGRKPKSRPVMVKIGREMLGLEEALEDSLHGSTCMCRSETGVLWAVSKEECLKRCQHALTANALKIRVSLESKFLKTRLGELGRAESLLQSFDEGHESPVKSASRQSITPVRTSSFRATGFPSPPNPYRNFLLAPHEAINSRMGLQPRNLSLSSPQRRRKKSFL